MTDWRSSPTPIGTGSRSATSISMKARSATSGKSSIHRLPAGRPDGSTVDRDGHPWNHAGGRVVRRAPDGRIDRVVERLSPAIELRWRPGPRRSLRYDSGPAPAPGSTAAQPSQRSLAVDVEAAVLPNRGMGLTAPVDSEGVTTMIIDHRTYTLVHGRMAEYLERYERVGLPIQLHYLERLVGFFVSDIGPQNQVVHMWAYDSIADRQERRDRMNADPAWQAFVKTNDGTFIFTKNKILRPTKTSPLR